MKVGLVGLGKMGQAIAYRLLLDKHEVVSFDPYAKKSGITKNIIDKNLEQNSPIKFDFANSLKELAKQVNIIWLMVPAGETVDKVIQELEPHLQQNTIVIDGGNSNFKNSIRRHYELIKKDIEYLDCGTSGGVHGKEIGFCLMIGGSKDAYKKVEPIFKSIATPYGYEYIGPTGAGHYGKMIHNGIEYSILQSYAEGFHLLHENDKYKNLDLEKISGVWMHGSVIRSFILDLAHTVFKQDQKLENISGSIGENQTGRWTIEQAKEQNIEMSLLQKSLDVRKWSRETGGNYATKVVAMLRNQFGGHEFLKK